MSSPVSGGDASPPLEPVIDRIRTTLRELEALRRRQAQSPAEAGGEPLRLSLDALRASAEELRTQAEALAAAQDALGAERARYRGFFDLAPVAYLVTDGDGVLLEANRTAAERFTLQEAAHVGRPLLEHVLVEDHPRFRDLLERARRLGRAADQELCLLSPSGEQARVAVSIARFDETGGTLLWSIRDIGERVVLDERARRLLQEEAASAESQAARQRITNILESISDAFVALDFDGRIVYLNRRAEQLLGRSRRELLGNLVWETFPELIGTTFEREYRRAVMAGVPVSFEEFYAPARAWVELHAFPTPDGLTIYFRNITRRKRIEEEHRFLARVSDELAASIDYQETLDRVAHLVIPILGDSCIVYTLRADGQIRRAAAVHSDAAKREAFQRMLRARPIDPLSTTSPVARAMRTGEPELMREISDAMQELLAVDAEQLQLLRQVGPRTLMVVPLISRGRTLGAISVASSAEDRRYADEDLALAVELARRAALALDNARLYAEARGAARARQEILHVVSHDLRNSLNAMLLHADLLLGSVAGEERRARGRPQVEAIRRAAEQMQRMVQDLLDVESIEAGRLSIYPERIDIGALLAEVTGALAPVAGGDGVELRLDAPKELPVLHADRGRLHQVLGNLIGNAIKFSPPGTAVEIGASLQANPHEVRFHVRDHGPGIPPADLPKVFDRYWKGQHDGWRQRAGVGLGLPIAKGIVEAHGGHIWAESHPEEGSTFYFTLPVARDAEG